MPVLHKGAFARSVSHGLNGTARAYSPTSALLRPGKPVSSPEGRLETGDPMSRESPAPSRTLRGVSFVLLLIGVFYVSSAFGMFAAFGVIIADAFFKPRSTRKRAYLSIVAAVALIAISSTFVSQRMNALRKWEGVASPSFAFTTLDGKQIQSADLRGKRVVLNFWATWCGVCKMEIPEINQLYGAAGDGDVAVFGVSTESNDKIRQFVAENPIDYPLVSLSGAPLPSPYADISALPTTFVLDRNGIIQFVRVGYLSGDQLRATALEAADHEGPIKNAPLEEVS